MADVGASLQGASLPSEEPPPSLGSLPDTVLHVLCGFLSAPAVLALRASSRLLMAPLSGEDADLGIWKARVTGLPVPGGPTCSYEQLFAFQLKYRHLIGDYLAQTPVVGGIVRFDFCAPDHVRGSVTTRPRVGNVAYSTTEILEITRAGGCQLFARGRSIAVAFQLSAEGELQLTLGATQLTMNSFRPLPSGALCTAGELPALGALGLGRYYYGEYGPHGTELLQLNWGALAFDGRAPGTGGAARGLRGLKVCGDPNVPAGRCSFCAWGELFPPAEATRLCPPRGRCACMFACDCLGEDEMARGDATVLGAMRGTATTARHGYDLPEHHPGRLVFFRPRAAPPLPGTLKSVCRAADAASAVHVLLIWDGRAFRTSTRLAPMELLPAAPPSE